MVEAGVPDYEVTTFNGIVAPAGTPDAIVEQLNAAMNEGLATAEVKDPIARTRCGLAARLAGAIRRVHYCADHQMAGCRKAANIKID